MRGTAVPHFTVPILAANAELLTELATWSVDGHVRWSGSLAFSPDDRLLAVGFDDKSDILLLSTANGEEIRTLHGHTGDVNSLTFSPDGQKLASSSWDQTVKVWDVATGQVIQTFNHPDTTYSVAFSPDGGSLAAGVRDGSIILWNLETGQKMNTFDGHTELVQHVTFSPDGSSIVSASFDGTIRVWDVATGQVQHTLSGHEGSVWDIAFSPDQTTAASASTDATIQLWDSTNWHEAGNLKASNPATTEWYDVAFIDNDLVAAASRDKLTLWNSVREQKLLTLEVDEGVQTVAVSNNGLLLATGGQGIVRLWGVVGNE